MKVNYAKLNDDIRVALGFDLELLYNPYNKKLTLDRYPITSLDIIPRKLYECIFKYNLKEYDNFNDTIYNSNAIFILSIIPKNNESIRNSVDIVGLNIDVFLKNYPKNKISSIKQKLKSDKICSKFISFIYSPVHDKFILLSDILTLDNLLEKDNNTFQFFGA